MAPRSSPQQKIKAAVKDTAAKMGGGDVTRERMQNLSLHRVIGIMRAGVNETIISIVIINRHSSILLAASDPPAMLM